MQNIFLPALLLVVACQTVVAQKEEGSKTIDITSSFKPGLMPPKKIVPHASPVAGSTAKPVLTYRIPAQQLSFRYAPAPLKPLAYSDTFKKKEDMGYVKAGFGSLSTPYLKAGIHFGNGKTSSGNVEALYTSSVGKMPYQEFARYGVKANAIFQIDSNHTVEARGGYAGQKLYRYGFQPTTLPVWVDSLPLNYNDIHVGATVGNGVANSFGLNYKAVLDGHFFSDNHGGNETALHYELPLQKTLSEKVVIEVKLKGVLSSLNFEDTSFSNNLTQLKAGAAYRMNDQLTLRAALIPSWSNGSFNLMPFAEVESYMPDKDLVLQAGVSGGYIENTWRSLAAFNPWIGQPFQMAHTRKMEFYAGLKGNFSENWYFHIKGGYEKRFNQPLFVNGPGDGKTFLVRWEPSLGIASGLGELVWQQGDKYTWSTSLLIQGFSGLEESSKAYGLLPAEINSSFRGKFLDKLTAKADLYLFAPTWRLNNGKPDKGEGGIDLNLGAEFDLLKNVKLWLQFNNLFNNEYQRWNQYPVLGFQAIGGVIFQF